MSRRFQFSLRRLLVVVTVAAAVAWTMRLAGLFTFLAGLICYGVPVCFFLWHIHATTERSGVKD